MLCEKNEFFAIFNKSMNFEIIFIYMNSIKSKFTSLTQKKLINLSKKKLNKISLIKSMIIGKKNVAGRNNSGKITVRHIGGGHKKKIQKN